MSDTMPTAEERDRLLVEGAKHYAMILLDAEGHIQGWSPGAEQIMGWSASEVLGQPADLIFTPEDRAAGVPDREMTKARAEGRALDLRWHMRKDGSRFFADGIMEPLQDGEARGFVKVLRDATEQAARAEREQFLADLSERAQGLNDPEEVIADAVRSVGQFLEVSRCLFADVDPATDACTISLNYCADETVTSMAGSFPLSTFGVFLVAEYAAGRTVVLDDVRAEGAPVPEGTRAAYQTVKVRAFVAAPVLHSARLVSVIAVHSPVPRHWTPEEVELLQAVVERTWLTVEVLRQQQALAREAKELRAAHERTAVILESITDAFFALDRSWRFTHVNDQAEHLLSRTRGELLERGIWDEFPAAVGSTFEHEYRRAVDEQTSVIFEEFYPPLDTWFEVRAYPSSDGLSVYFHDINGRKALEAERERLAERERNIAQQLQAALTPAIPEGIPGMALAKHYEAALAEAGVGGDFYDVFPVDKGCTAIVVGDLSGKGLAAASQVATVRNMLRYALYRSRTLVGALHSLNSLLVDQGLLTGFATLFVGAFDGGAGTLTYVNCGQEPALVRREGTGLVEQLTPTGPVLGSFEGAAFEERTVTLLPGDALAVFTDGLTEVGKSRREMLGLGGVMGLLENCIIPPEADSADAVAEHLTLWLISAVEAAAAGGVMRDDVCLMVGVVE